MPAVALTDHGRCGELLKFYEECKKAKVKPILGCEYYCSPQHHTLKEQIEGFKPCYHLVALAKTHKGVENLFQLSSLSWIEGKYFKPRVSVELLEEYKEDLIILSGCASGYIASFLMNDNEEEAYNHAKRLREIFKDDFYIEAQNHGIDWQLPLKEKLFKLSSDLDIPIVATQDAHYQNKEDAFLHSNVCKLTMGDLQFESDQLYFKSYEEMCEMFEPNERHAIDRTIEVAEKCNGEWNYGKTIWPVIDLPEGVTVEEKFEEQVWKGFKEKFGEGTQEYRDRIEYETGIIESMGFPNYFLVVADYIKWAKEQGILVGPGRGSGPSSLCGYCLGITGIDPIKYNLPFVRFLNPSRVNPPDYDIDFQDTRRHEVISYMYEKYGQDRVSQIGTYSAFKPKGSLRDFARVTGEEFSVGDILSKRVPAAKSGKELKWEEILAEDPGFRKTDWPDVVNLSIAAEGINKQCGVHAAGLLVSNDTISKTTPLFVGRGGEIASQFDMTDVEKTGLVKYDFLGLRILSILADAIRFVKENKGVQIDLDSIKEKDGDINVYRDIFWSGDLDGVFQFETSSGFKDLCMKVKPKSIKNLSAITALFRPGPIGVGATSDYSKRKEGKSFEYDHTKLEPILKETVGIMVFQEQIISICVELAGYNMSEADNMRRIIGKKKLDKIPAEKEKFISGCVANNIDKPIAEKVFKDIEGFAEYCFNVSHSISYSVISYQTAWIKYYYPLEYYAALLNNSLNDQDRMIRYIYSAKKKDIYISQPDINLSSVDFAIRDKAILFSLVGIKGIGTSAAEAIIQNRPEDGYKSIHELFKAKIKKNVIQALIVSGALDEISEVHRSQMINNLEILSEYYKKVKAWEEKLENFQQRELERRVAKDRGEKKIPRKRKDPGDKPPLPEMDSVRKMSKKDRLGLERHSLGFYISGHPLDDFDHISRDFTISDILEGKAGKKATCKLPVVLSKLVKKRTKKGKNMANAILEDQTGRLDIAIFPKQWETLKDVLEEGNVYLTTLQTEAEEIIDEEGSSRVSIKAFMLRSNELTYVEVPEIVECQLPNNATIVFEVGDDVSVESVSEVNRIISEVLE